MKPRSIILGLDASARRIGWACIDHDTAELVSIGCEHTAAGDDLRNRRNAVKEIAAQSNTRGDVCAVFVEDAYAGPSRAGTIQHAGAVGNVEAFALERWPQLLVERIAPATWRSILGLPNAGKEPVVVWAQAATQRAMWTQDEADAYAIATCGHMLVWKSHIGIGETARNNPQTPEGKEATR